MFKKKVIVPCFLSSLSFIILSHPPANAARDVPNAPPQPQVIVETVLGDHLASIGAALPEDKSKVYSFSNFTNYLGENTSVLNIKKYIKEFHKQIKLNKENFSFDTYHISFDSTSKQSYISKNSIILGYITEELYDVTHHQDKGFITSIRSMQNNREYDSKVPRFQGGELKAYISEHDGYVEEYAFLELDDEIFGKAVYLVLQAFYPKLLESQMKPNITEILFDYANVNW